MENVKKKLQQAQGFCQKTERFDGNRQNTKKLQKKLAFDGGVWYYTQACYCDNAQICVDSEGGCSLKQGISEEYVQFEIGRQ